MSENIVYSDAVHDERKVIVNGRRYYTMTANKCTVCSGDEHYMYLKQKHTGGCVTLECVNCDSYMTIRAEMVNYNLNG
jgi:hypothetical protein